MARFTNRLSPSTTRSLILGAGSLSIAAFLAYSALGQLGPVNGMRPADVRAHAIVDATVVTEPGQKIEHATIVIRDGVIEAVGPSDQVKAPAGARIWKGEGMTVYPGLIEPALMVRADAAAGAGSHWNTRVRPEVNMIDQPAPEAALRKELRGMGFTAAAVYPNSGALRGTGALLALAEDNEHVLAYQPKLAMAMTFDYGGGGGRRGGGAPAADANASAYPGSLMGGIALLRQTLHDARWRMDCLRVWLNHPDGNEPPIRADALDAMAALFGEPNLRMHAHNGGSIASPATQSVLFDASDELNALRAAKLAREFNLNMILIGSGMEFRHLDAVLSAKLPILVPLEFPKRPEVGTLSQADSVSLRDMMIWEQAPTNPRRLLRGTEQNPGVPVAFTTHRLRSRGDFHANIRTAIKHGITEDEALAALTTTPAELMGVQHLMGTIEPGKAANLVVVKGSLFDKERKIYDTWVNGRRYEITKDADVQMKGSGTLKVQLPNDQTPNGAREMTFDVDTVKNAVTIHLPDKKKVAAKKVVVQQDQLSFVTDGRPIDEEGYLRFSGVIEGNPPSTVTGTGARVDGSTFQFEMTIKPNGAADESEPKAEDAVATPDAVAAPASEPATDPVSGEWSVRLEEMPDSSVTLNLKLDENNRVSGTVNAMGATHDIADGTFDPATGKLSYAIMPPDGQVGNTEATVSGASMIGTYTSAAFTAKFTASKAGVAVKAAEPATAKKEEEKFEMPPEQLNYPLGEYGRMSPPQAQNFIVTNATIWTAGPQGIIKSGWMRIENGKIADIGNGAAPSGGTVIDLAGKHITPGLIDCHSHTGINGSVNEFAQTNTAECRIADCIDPTAINWYRQLAGGLTACNQLHGSANPIGGQNSVVKLKWGAAGGPDAFPIADAIPGIKFALGENVKRSTARYPNTRMGVETFIRDAFTAAREYKAKWDRYLALPTEQKARTMPPQRDLELDTLVEILGKQRLVHCHSYRQDEILMLIRVAEDFGFTIGTFQHVLEGYKVADAIGRHGAGASSFSDWWAYKIEVIDAIPYNGALMKNVGVNVSFNSDSDELARRMNWEAAKAVRYGGIDPHEALKFVTINPAWQLRIDHRTGSLEKGKDADFAIWSGDPLSTYSRCEQTWIEGAKYFDIDEDKQMRAEIHRERQRLIQKILAQAHGQPVKPGADEKEGSTAGEGEGRTRGDGAGSGADGERRMRRRPPQGEALAWMEEQVRLGRDPEEVRPGVCGCGHEHE